MEKNSLYTALDSLRDSMILLSALDTISLASAMASLPVPIHAPLQERSSSTCTLSLA